MGAAMSPYPNFEAQKIAMKQDKEGMVLTLRIHPDELPAELMRDFVGSRYQVVMVRLDGEDKPMKREQEHSTDWVRMAGILSRDPAFPKWLTHTGELLEPNDEEAVEWLRDYLGVKSRADIPDSETAKARLRTILQEFNQWKN
jgi:hypothetical protein